MSAQNSSAGLDWVRSGMLYKDRIKRGTERMRNRNGERLAWQSIHQALCSKDSSKQKRCMALILRSAGQMTQLQWQKRCQQLYRTDSVEGPAAVAWGLQQMATMQPPGKDRNMILNQMDTAKNDAAVMRRIRKGWQAFGVDDPWWVVHGKPGPPIPRYHSEPILQRA